MDMDVKIQIALIGGCFLVLILIMNLTRRITKKITAVKNLDPNRKKVVLNVFYFVYYILFFAGVFAILGIDLQELSIFLSSILAILGIAFVAQWSHLSNLTASIIIFFYHPLKIGDTVKLLDKEFDFVGVVEDISGFYITIRNKDTNQDIVIPNSMVLQKGIQFIEKRNYEDH